MLRRIRFEDGYSLPEVLISATIGVVLLTAVFGILQSVMSGYAIQADQAEAQSGAQLALIKITRELRQAEKPLLTVSSSPGSYETLAFKADLNDDGTSEAVMYFYNYYAGTLTKRVNTTGVFDFTGSPSDAIAKNVRNSTGQAVFTYYGTSLSTPLDPASPGSDVINKTRLVKIRLIVDKDLAKAPKQIDLMSEIKLRNFGY